MEPAGFNPENLWLAEARITRSAEEEGGARLIDGIASTGITDRMGTNIDQKSLGQAARKYAARNGKIFYNHNWTTPIGRAREVHVRDDGLHLRAEIGTGYPIPVQSLSGGFGSSTVTMQVDDIWSMIRQGILSSYSIGFDGRPDPEDESGKRILVRDLFEISVVSIPANPDAEFAVARALWSFPFGDRFAIRNYPLTEAPGNSIVWDTGSTTSHNNTITFSFEPEQTAEVEGQSGESIDYAAVMEELRQCRSL